MFKGVLDDEEERMRLINQTLSTLTAREEKVLRLYYGIDDRRSTLPEIGQDFNITQDWVRRIKNRGVIKIINRVTKYEPFIYYFSSEVDKDLIARCIDKRKSKLFDEFMVKLLKIDWEEWVLK